MDGNMVQICRIGFQKEEKWENEGQAILKNNIITENDPGLIKNKTKNMDLLV